MREQSSHHYFIGTTTEVDCYMSVFLSSFQDKRFNYRYSVLKGFVLCQHFYVFGMRLCLSVVDARGVRRLGTENGVDEECLPRLVAGGFVLLVDDFGGECVGGGQFKVEQ